MTSRSGRRPLVTLLAFLGLLLAGQVAVAATASAHTELVSTAPADGAQVASSPSEVTLTFSRPVGPDLAQVQVSGPQGDPWQAGDPQVDGATVTQPLTPLDDAGTYAVAWRVVASDGHPISGTFSFTFSGEAPQPAETGTPSATAPTAAELPDETAPTAATTEQGSSWLPVVGGLVAAAILLAVVTAVLSRRRRATEGTGS